MERNPFSLSFGVKPNTYIERSNNISEITDAFSYKNPVSNTFMVTGVRGSGKTVFLSNLKKFYDDDESWIVLFLNINSDLISSSVAELQRKNFLSGIQNFELSVGPISINTNSEKTNAQKEVILRNYLESAKKKGKKVLFLIDEVVNNETMREFAGFFQIYLSSGYPVYLVMAGLYENINNLQNADTLTFLYRAPKIILSPLSINDMTRSYSKIFNIPFEEAKEMAKTTKGFPFAFQILGYLRWQENKPLTDILQDFDDKLTTFVYEKVWSELSDLDKRVIKTISAGKTKVADIREELDFSSQKANVYRKRLIDRGIISKEPRGYMELTLPRFEEFVKLYCE